MAAAAAMSSTLSFPCPLPTSSFPRHHQWRLRPRPPSLLLAPRQQRALLPGVSLRRGPLSRYRRIPKLTAPRASAQEEGDDGSGPPDTPEASADGGISATGGGNAEAAEAVEATARRILSERGGGGGTGGGEGGDLSWGGVAEEVGEIEWPAFGKVVGTTGVVIAVIAGSSVALLTVNAVLAELSDRVFAGRGIQDFFSG